MHRVTGQRKKQTLSNSCGPAAMLTWMNAARDWPKRKTQPLKIRAPGAAQLRDECTATGPNAKNRLSKFMRPGAAQVATVMNAPRDWPKRKNEPLHSCGPAQRVLPG
jgi:hypothetical protein